MFTSPTQRFSRQIVNTTAVKALGTVKVTPDAAAQSDADLLNFAKDNLILFSIYLCCTVSMLLKQKGGIVGSSAHICSGIRCCGSSLIGEAATDLLDARDGPKESKSNQVLVDLEKYYG
jgi:hypothetical protein